MLLKGYDSARIERFKKVKKFCCFYIIFLFCQTAIAQITYDKVFVDYDSAIEFRNLKLIPVRMKGPSQPVEVMSFSAAMQKGLVVVSERGSASTENVHWLRIKNNSKKAVFVGSGELVAGGRQDRVVTKDTVLAPDGKDQYIEVMCVEEERWSRKEKKFVYQNYANPKLRKVVDQSKNQVVIWREIFAQLDSTNTPAPTLSYVARRTEKRLITVQDQYMRFFREWIKKQDSTIIGFVCVTNEKVMGSDILATPSLFYEEWEALLHGYVEEAIAFGKEPDLTDDQVRKYMDRFMKDETQQEQYLRKHGKLFRYKGKVIHLTSYHD